MRRGPSRRSRGLPSLAVAIFFVLVATVLVAGIPFGPDGSAVVAAQSAEPVAVCTVSSTYVAAGEEVTIDAGESKGAEVADFDFNGDNEFEETWAEKMVATTSYDEPGEYTPIVRVWDTATESSDVTKCDTIAVAENHEPTADFEFSPDQPRVGEKISFDASASSDPDGSIVEYRWDFDENGAFDLTTDEPTTAHAFAETGMHWVTLDVIDDGKAVDETEIGVYVAPYARCTISDTAVEPGEEVTIDATESEGADSADFDFDGDGEPDETWVEEMVATTSYDAEGEYTPSVLVRNWATESWGEAECGSVTVAANEEPTADFDYSPDQPRLAEEISFDASGSSDPDGSIVEYRWDFDNDGTFELTTSEPTTTHAFDGTGAHRVGLEVTDDDGAVDETAVWVYVSPYARCELSATSVRPGETVTIDVTGSEGGDFADFDVDGDGVYDETWTEEFVRTTSYDEPGEYAPRVRVFNQSSEQTDEAACPSIAVVANEEPTADFEFSPDQPRVGEEISFDAGGSFDPDGEVVEYRWDFDNDDTFELTTSSPTTTRTYDGTGAHRVTLEVTDGEGATDQIDSWVYVSPYARCELSETSVRPGEPVTIDATGSEGGDAANFDLDGDGEFDTGWTEEMVATTAYDAEDEYAPRVLVRNWMSESSTEVECGTITVAANEPPEAAFEFSPDRPEPGEGVAFDASGSSDPDGSIVEYRWDFDDDGTIDETTTDPVVEHTYGADGTRTVTLTVVDDEGATTSSEEYVTVYPTPPVAQCSLSETSVRPGETMTIDAGDSANAAWVDFDLDGDGTYDETRYEAPFVVTTSYDEPGTYEPRVRVWGPYERFDEADCGTITVAANGRPTADFEFSPEEPRVGEEVTFDASGSSDPDGSIVEYRWDFADDGTFDAPTSDPVAVHTFAETGAHRVTLEVTDDEGAIDETAVWVYVSPYARCELSATSVRVGETVTIDASGSEGGDFADFDFDGDGTYDETRVEGMVATTSYDEPGEYAPRVRVWNQMTESSAVVECDSITVAANEEPTAAFEFDPAGPEPGEEITFDASGSSDPDGPIVEYRWDFDGDGTVDETTPDPVTDRAYESDGTWTVTLTVVDAAGATASSEGFVAVYPPPPVAQCSVSPSTVAPLEAVSVSAGEAGDIAWVDFDLDGDGTYDETRYEAPFTVTTRYGEEGEYTPRIRVWGPYERFDEATCATVTVENREPLIVAFDATPASPEVNETVTFDASASSAAGSSIAEYRWDFDGDGTVDETTPDPATTRSFPTAGSRTVTLTVVTDDERTASATNEVSVVEPPADEPTEEGLLSPLGDVDPIVPAIVGVLAGLGAAAWFLGTPSGGGGGSGGGDGDRPSKPPRPPRPREGPEPAQYDAGVFAVPASSGVVSVTDVGFEPDLLVFTAANASREDGATDRTAGWTTGVARRTADGFDQRAVTVADDGAAIDGATCATTTGDAFDLVRHDEGLPGRVRGRVVATSERGFDVDVSVPATDPAAGGIRVCYRAFRFATDVSATVGHFLTPTEPGAQTVDLGVDADHVVLHATSAVGDADRGFTTDRAVGLSVGTATGRERPTQTCWSGAAWPGPSGGFADGGSRERVLELAYLEGDRLAGTTTAAAVELGERLRLRYDRVYSGPNKLGSVARHVVTYVAIDTAEEMTPATGAVRLPEPGESVSVACGFEPGLVEVDVPGTTALEGPSPTGASATPFDWSTGAAVAVGADVERYAIHATVGGPTGAAGVVRAPADGRPVADGGTVAARENATTADDSENAVPTTDPDVEAASTDAGIAALPPDGLVGARLARDDRGRIVGRDDVDLSIGEAGFELSVRGVRTADRPTGERPYVFYRAWPKDDEGPDRSNASTNRSGDAPNVTGDEPITDTTSHR